VRLRYAFGVSGSSHRDVGYKCEARTLGECNSVVVTVGETHVRPVCLMDRPRRAAAVEAHRSVEVAPGLGAALMLSDCSAFGKGSLYCRNESCVGEYRRAV